MTLPWTISWDSYRFVAVLYRLGTLTAAARELGVNQSTASRWLKELEKEAGCTLFSLENKVYKVTPVGKRWLRTAERMEEAFRRNPPDLAHATRKRVRVTTFDFLLNEFILPRWERFGFDSSVQYEFDASSRDHDLKSTSFDFALRLARPEHLGPLKMRRLASIAIGRVCRNDVNEADAGWVDRDPERTAAVEEKLAVKYRKGKSLLQVSSYAGVVKAVLGGKYVGLVPLVYLSTSSQLRLLSRPNEIIRREVWLLMKESYTSDPVLRNFMKRLCEGFKIFGKDLDGR